MTAALKEPTARRFRAIGTTCSLLVTDDDAADAAADELRRFVGELDATCSRFRMDAELTRFAARAEPAGVVSPLLGELVAAALAAAAFTDGAVDPTVGGALVALGYDRDFADVAPTGTPLASSPQPAPGWRCVELSADRRRLCFPAGVTLDLGSSAKAVAADRAAATIAGAFGTGVLVNLGGDIAAAGTAPEGGWRIGLSLDAATDPGAAHVVVAITAGGLASSGTRVRAWRRGERELHHIVDPRTGDVAVSPFALVSVAAASCLVANAAATASIVMGAEAPEWLEARGLPARLVRHDGAVCTVGGWPPD